MKILYSYNGSREETHLTTPTWIVVNHFLAVDGRPLKALYDHIKRIVRIIPVSECVLINYCC